VASGVASSCAAPADSVASEASFSFRKARACASAAWRRCRSRSCVTRVTKYAMTKAATANATHMPCRCKLIAAWS
jgi:hypothetical protein